MSIGDPKSASLTARTNSGGFKLPDGTLYVSKPFRSRASKKLRAAITFTPRKSHFDTTNESSGSNEFRVSLPFVYAVTQFILVDL
jgi:sterol O-acyltransferase